MPSVPTAVSRPPTPNVAIAGAGWAGLACALELMWAGVHVTLLESSRQAGGRARTVTFDGLAVDNGQHLLVGAYRETLRITRRLGLEEPSILARSPLDLQVLFAGERIALKATSLPAPLHLAAGLLAARGLSLAEKLAATRLTLRLHRTGFGLQQDITVSELFERDRQPARLTAVLWEPLCLAALNTPAQEASAVHFLRVLRDTFLGGRDASDFLHPRVALGQLFAEPALQALRAGGAQVRMGVRLEGFRHTADGIAAATSDGEVAAGHLVIATGPAVARRVLAAHPATATVAAQLAGLREDAPIATVYLRYPPGVRLGCGMVGLVGGLGQWVIDRGDICGQAGLMAVVMSGAGPHMTMAREALEREIASELAGRFPHWPPPEAMLTIREKRATFHCTPDADRHRPPARTPDPRVWLAGDYTATGYPATLEGAVRSGVECARLILSPASRSSPC